MFAYNTRDRLCKKINSTSQIAVESFLWTSDSISFEIKLETWKSSKRNFKKLLRWHNYLSKESSKIKSSWKFEKKCDMCHSKLSLSKKIFQNKLQESFKIFLFRWTLKTPSSFSNCFLFNLTWIKICCNCANCWINNERNEEKKSKDWKNSSRS